MEIVDLINQLQEIVKQCGEEQVVTVWCPDREGYFPVSGFVYDNEGLVHLITEQEEDYGDE